MLIDTRQLPDGETINADVCIIGAGAAGISLALELAKARLNVCLLESGGAEFDAQVQDLYAGPNADSRYYDLDVARLRFLGGTTNHWTGWCRPFRADDFEARSWIPHSGWPITNDDIEPYLQKTHEILDLGPVDFTPSFWQSELVQREAFNKSDFIFSGQRLVTHIYQNSLPTRFKDKYFSALTNSEYIALYTNASIVEIETNEVGSAITRLQGAHFNGKKFFAQGKAYIVAAGGIENARLLLASGNSRLGGLGNAHGHVGRFFMVHLHVQKAAEIIVPESDLEAGYYFPKIDQKQTRLTRAIPALAMDLLQEERLLGVEFALTPVTVSPGLDSLNALSNSTDNLGEHIWNITRDFGNVVDAVYKRMRNTSTGPGDFGDLVGMDVRAILEQAPNPDSRVVLAEEKDALGMRRIQLDWQLTSLEKRSLRRGLEILGMEIGRLGIGRLKTTVDVTENSNVWPDITGVGFHHIGTTRMSKEPEDGVVDRNCRVHGTENLYVAGSSVFVTAGTNTPTYSIVAFALRLAEHLRTRLA